MSPRKPPTRKSPAAKRKVATDKFANTGRVPARPGKSSAATAQPEPPAKRPAHRPPWEPTQTDRNTVRVMVAAGIDHETIALTLGKSPHTIRKHFRREIDTAYAQVKARIAGKLIAKADAGDVACMIFYMKTHGWNERLVVADGGLADADPVTMTDAEIEARIARLRRTGAAARKVGASGTIH
jgi:hypothetical protein